MRRFIWVTLVLVFAISAGAVAVRAGSTISPPRLATLLTYPDGSPCQMPCLLGIRPGFTRRQQVIGLLRLHPFVQDPDSSLCMEAYNFCEFRLRGLDFSGIVQIGADEKVVEIYLSLDLNKAGRRSLLVGDFISLFGPPDKLIPHYECCSTSQFDRYVMLLEQFDPTHGFWLSFTPHGFMVKDYATFVNGSYSLRPEAPVLGIRVVSTRPDDNPNLFRNAVADPVSPWARWYGFMSARRYFMLAGNTPIPQS